MALLEKKILGIDLGTTTIKTVVVDTKKRSNFPTKSRSDNLFELNCLIVDRLIVQLPSAAELR